jgi:hypothetical protein
MRINFQGIGLERNTPLSRGAMSMVETGMSKRTHAQRQADDAGRWTLSSYLLAFDFHTLINCRV